MESIAADLRRGIWWAVLPVGLASLLRLALEPAYWHPLYALWFALIAGFAAGHGWLLRRPTPLRLRLAVLLNFVGINLGYQTIGAVLGTHAGWRADDLVHAVDLLTYRGDPQRFLVALQAPWLSTVVMAGYLGFAGYLFYLFLSEVFRLTVHTGRVQLGLMRLYGFGFAGYLLLPAEGPAFHHPALLPAIAHSPFSARLQPWVLGNCSRVDVCPSIHAAVCAFLLVWTWHRRRWLCPWLMAPSAALLLGTVYLQYHYFTDLPFGLLLGTLAALSVTHANPAPLHPSPSPAS